METTKGTNEKKKMVLSVLEKFAASASRPQIRSSSPWGESQQRGSLSVKTRVALVVARASVRLDVGLLDASAATEVSLGFAHSRASKQERVGAYYNYILS